MKLTSQKRAYWEFGKYISESSNAGLSVREILRRLEEELEGTELRAPHEGTASKLRKAYEIYVQTYGFDIEDLEDISALNLWQAYTELKITQTQQDASALVNRLNAGEKFNKIRAEEGASKKSKAEHYIEAINNSITSDRGSNQEKMKEVRELIKKYKTLIGTQRRDTSKADQLFIEYSLQLIKIALKN